MDAGSSPKRRRVAFVLTNNIAVRNTLETPVLAELSKRTETEVCFVIPSTDEKCRGITAKSSRITWASLNDNTNNLPLTYGSRGLVARRLAERALLKGLRRWTGWGNLVFRFNERHGFVGHRFKKKFPPERRERENLAGNYPDPRFGTPFPQSGLIFNLIYKLYFNLWYSEPEVEAFLDEYCPEVLVLNSVQNEIVKPWISSARRRCLPVVGIVGSWDQPTTKGPLPPGLEKVVVQSEAMRRQVMGNQRIPSKRVLVTGWPQMDHYKSHDAILPRDDLLRKLGIDAHRRYLLYGTNSPRLGPHEPLVARHIAAGIHEGRYADQLNMVIRPHPKDELWEERFFDLHKPPWVVVLPPESGRLDFMTSQLYHASVVLASSGTILLDAIALDTCSVNIAFDGGLYMSHHDSIKRWTEMDHYKPVISSGGVKVVESFTDMDKAIAMYLADPAEDAQGRKRCRIEQLEPFDGNSSLRLVEIIYKAADRDERF